jgi:hypothetical protein
MIDDSTGTVIWPITLPVIFLNCRDLLTGMVTWLITVPVTVQSVAVALPVQ